MTPYLICLVLDFILEDFDKGGKAIELCLCQYSLITEVGVYDHFTRSKKVEDGWEISGVSVHQVSTIFILQSIMNLV